MILGIPKEIIKNETRIAVIPATVKQFIAAGFTVIIESKAGETSQFSDSDFKDSGAEIVLSASDVFSKADMILKVSSPTDEEIQMIRQGSSYISFFQTMKETNKVKALQKKNITAYSMHLIPGTALAQKMDALSSQTNIAGYKAVLIASCHIEKYMPLLMTAAGTIPPAKVLVLGAGVAGLSAIATAKRLGAQVEASDVRPEVKEQVESMGADFLLLDFKEDGSGEGGYAKTMSDEFIAAEMALFTEQAKDVDIIITTALIPGKPAPKLITKDMVNSMKNGSVIVDLAAEQGGNCELTLPHDVNVTDNGVTIIGYSDLPSRLPTQSSQLYGTNLRHLLTDMTPEKDGQMTIDMEDEAVRGATVIKEGQITWPPPPPKLSATPAVKQTEPVPVVTEEPKKPTLLRQSLPLIIGALILYALGSVAPSSFMTHFTVFVLSCFIGYMVIWNVTASLHTPLMSVTNAVSSIIIIGALIQISSSDTLLAGLAAFGILITSINIAGGFAVTKRMLDMFRK